MRNEKSSKNKNNSLINDITGLVKATGMAKVLEIAEISETDMLKKKPFT